MANLFPASGTTAKGCTHKVKIKRVLSSAATCETTALFCASCGEQLTKPKTDCV